MPNATVRAIARAMPIDRRAALGALAGGALLAAPCIAKPAEVHPDAELLALSRRAREISAGCRRAIDAADALKNRYELPPIPQALVVTTQDAEEFGPLMAEIGERFHFIDVSALSLHRAPGTRPEALARVAEVQRAEAEYAERKRASREAFGIPAANARAAAMQDEASRVLDAVAFIRPKTVDGVLAKLAAVAPLCRPIDPSQPSDIMSNEAKVLVMAALDLVTLKGEA